MSQKVERSDQDEALALESALEALRQSPEFRGPVEPLDDHDHSNDHFALIHESREEQFAAAIPFVRQGLERGEQCLYIADENSREDVLEAMRADRIDVDAALESGALIVQTKQDTYLRDGTFDPDEMIAFLEDAIADATEEYETLRITAEMTWVFDDEPEVEDLIEYEGKLNTLFPGVDSIALCQYNRNRFPPDVIQDIIRTHPHLIHDNVVSHNVYYTPPEEFFGPEQPVNEVDRMMGTLRERTETKVELEDRQQFLREQNEITASPDQTFEEQLQALFELGCDQFDLELGAMAQVDTEDDWFEIESVSADHEHFAPGVELPLSETYCTAATEIKAAGSVSNPLDEGYDDITVYQDFGLQAYLGTYVEVDGGANRTFFFVSSEPREDGFSADERAFIRLMGQWVKHELERRHRERFLRESYKITSNPERSFEEKLEQLLDLGREWFGLEMAALSELPSWDGKFRLEKGIGLGVEPEEKPFWTDPGEECFCRQTITEDTPVSQVDVRETQWADDSIYQELGLTSYLGMKVTSGSTPYGTLWFGSTEPRERPFSGTERTFIELMGQWVSYEIERRDHKQAQRELYEITADTERTFDEKLQTVFELGCGRFDLDLGGMARIDPDTDRFEMEYVSDDHEHLKPGGEVALSETYCRVFADGGETAGITEPVADGFDGTRAYNEFGVKSYLGTRIGLDDQFDRTLFFISAEPRKTEFSAAERTFLHLMGQWVQYELERERRERELRERTEHLSALIETTPDCIKTVAADGTLLQMNPAGLEMGDADSESDVVGESVYDLVASEHRERYREFNERICSGERGTLEFDIIGLEGTRRHMESHAAPLEHPDGTTVQVAVTRDITEQVERDRELERALDLLEKTERTADVGGWEIDPETREVFWTEHLFELLEVNADEEPPLDEALDVYHEEDRPIIEGAVEEALESGNPFDVEARFRTPTSEVRWLRVQGVPKTVGDDVVSLRGAAQDVTERKQREQRLEESERRYRVLVENFPNGSVGLFDEDLRYTAVGGQLFDELDFEPGDRIGQSLRELHPPDVVEEIEPYFEAALDGEANTFEVEFSGRHLYANTLPITDTTGKVFAGMLVIQDVTERREYERQLEQSNDRLKQFAYAASHDLQEPLRMVSSYLQLLENQYEDDLDEDAQEYIDFAVDGADRMRAMVEDLLAYSRVEQADGEFEPIECEAVIDNVRADLQVQIEEHDAELIAEPLPTVMADREQLEQLFDNLVSNAIKYSGDVPPKIEITADSRANHWEFAVADNGIGMDPDKSSRIFEVFKRLHHEDEYPGTGIGLSLCQEIVENHGGDIWVESEPGEGSTFSFTIPRREAEL